MFSPLEKKDRRPTLDAGVECLLYCLLSIVYSLYFPRTYWLTFYNFLLRTIVHPVLTYVIEIFEKVMITKTHPTQTININF